MKTELFNACDQAFFSGLNGLYQGVLITLLVALGLRVLSRTNAATRHAIWLITLGLVAFLIPAHWLRDYLENGTKAKERTSLAPALAGSRAPLRATGDSAGTEPLFPVLLSAPDWIVESTELPSSSQDPPEKSWIAGESLFVPVQPRQRENRDRVQTSSAQEFDVQPAADQIVSVLSSIGAEKPLGNASRLLQPVALSVAPAEKIPRGTSLVLLAGCIGVGLVRVGFLVRRVAEVRRLKSKASSGGAAMNELFERLLLELGVRRKVQLRVSALHRSPVLLGFIHTVVLIPADQPGEPGVLEPILRHELAHVRRRDDWANLAQNLVQALLFFHPAVWWINRQLSIEREIACDDHVLQQGARAKSYALLLVEFASRFRTSRGLLAPGVSNSNGQLQKRIDMILNTKRNSSPRLAKTRLGVITSAAIVVAAFAIYAAPRLVLAQTGPNVALAAAPDAQNTQTPSAPAAGIVLVTPSTTPTGVAVAESPDTPPPTPRGIEPGPKNKSQNNPDLVGPAELATPVIPRHPAAIVVGPSAGHPPYVVAIARAPEPPHTSPKPLDPSEGKESDASIEERLRRLEKIVESLAKKQDRKAPEAFMWKGQPGQQAWMDPEKLKEMRDAAQQDAARAAEHAKRATSEAEKEIKLQQERAQGTARGDFAQQIQTLEKQRAALERAVERLQSQIEHLEQQRDKLEQDRERLQEQKQRHSQLLQESLEESSDMARVEQPEIAQPGAPALPRR